MMRDSSHSLDKISFNIQTVQGNTTVIAQANHWNVLRFKEVVMIKHRTPNLNSGLNALRK